MQTNSSRASWYAAIETVTIWRRRSTCITSGIFPTNPSVCRDTSRTQGTRVSSALRRFTALRQMTMCWTAPPDYGAGWALKNRGIAGARQVTMGKTKEVQTLFRTWSSLADAGSALPTSPARDFSQVTTSFTWMQISADLVSLIRGPYEPVTCPSHFDVTECLHYPFREPRWPGERQQCPEGSSTFGAEAQVKCQCLPGYYTVEVNSTLSAICKQCQEGFYCSGGAEIACQENSHSEAGARSADDCLCNNGYAKVDGVCLPACVAQPGHYCPLDKFAPSPILRTPRPATSLA
mmetsp:Transcript_7912/g.12569  ORF Transcript_7912/g.12569 Transcript_7912/m.12569 type:complete len:292 (+) Transcript_7912:246-1121(+)